MSLKLGTQDISGISQNTKYNAHHLLDFKWTDCIMNDVSWLRADTFSWQSGDVYTSAYNHLVADLSGTTAETETIGSYTVTFYRADDGHKICLADQETTVLNIYNESGIAWYYIVDTVNTQFKLPRTKFGFEGLRNNVGDKIDESLPNIRGGFISIAYPAGYSGAFYQSSQATGQGAWGSSGFYDSGTSLDASRSSSTYQNNAPVQERATQMYLYFYVGDYTQSAIEQTAGLNAGLFNGKADVSLNNINNTAKITMAHNAMPSPTTFIRPTLGASGASYIALADGYVFAASVSSAAGQYIYLTNSNVATTNWSGGGSELMQIYLPVSKGDTYILAWTSAAPTEFKFVYAVGSESEAS